MSDFQFGGMTAEMQPAITKWSFEDLGDDAASHRWRAWWASGDIYGEVGGIELRAYPVIKHTPCGVWIDELAWRHWEGQKQVWRMSSHGKRFVNNGSGQGWVKPTQEEAIKSLAIRLCRWSNRIASDVRRAKSAATALEKLRPDLADFAETSRKNLVDAK
jgi:hypothetical protein